MSIGPNQRDLQQLHTLYELKEKRALEAVAEQRIELNRVLERLAEQKALIQQLRDELKALHEKCSNTNIADMTARSLVANSERRRWLVDDLELEVFYLPGFDSDVDEARAELAKRKRESLRAADRIKALDQQLEKLARNMRRADSRKSDAMLEDRLNNTRATHG